MNIDTVKPMPQSIQTLANERQSAPEGSVATFSLMKSHENDSTPTNLPTTNPRITARLTPETTSVRAKSLTSTPALAKAKSGMMM